MLRLRRRGRRGGPGGDVALKRGDIGARTERSAGSGDDHSAGGVVQVNSIEGGDNRGQQFGGEGV